MCKINNIGTNTEEKNKLLVDRKNARSNCEEVFKIIPADSFFATDWDEKWKYLVGSLTSFSERNESKKSFNFFFWREGKIAWLES